MVTQFKALPISYSQIAGISSLRSDSWIIILFLLSVSVVWFVSLHMWARWHSSKLEKMDWVEGGFLSFVTLVILIGWISVILDSLGIFSLLWLSIILFIITGLAIWFQRPIGRLEFSRPSFYELALIVLLLGCCLVYFRPHEYILGGTDAGSYINTGATIARTGSFVIEDDWTSFLTEHKSVALREQPQPFLTRYLQFVGWYIDDADPSRIIPQFFPFHPTLIAIGISLAGLRGGLLVTPLWSVLSIAAVYFLARKIFDARVGLLAVLLLAITPTQIFFSRYPTAEPLTLLLVFSGLLAFQALWDEPSSGPIWGSLGGAAFGAAFLTRIDLPIVLILIVGALFVCWGRDRWSRGWWAFVIVLSIFLGHLCLSVLFINWPYFWNIFSTTVRTIPRQSPALLVVGAAGFLFLLMGFLFRIRLGLNCDNLRRMLNSYWFRWLLIIMVILSSGYAYFLRPAFGSTKYYSHWPGNGQVPILNRLNWVRLGWYLTPLGLLLATLGLARIFYKESFTRLGFFLGVGFLTTTQFIYKSFIPPYHIYMMRRYVPIVIPMLMIYISVAIVSVFDARRVRFRQIIGLLLMFSLTGGLIYQSRFVLLQRDYYDAVEQVTSLNDRLKSDAIIVINEPIKSMFSDQVGVPLRFIFGHDVATIRSRNEEIKPFVSRMLEYADEQDRPVQLIAINPIAPALREALSLEPIEMFPIKLRRLQHTFDEYPSDIQKIYYGIEIYDVSNTSLSASKARLPIEIDVGTLDAAFIREGFHNKELLPGMPTMRWTSGEAILDIPLSSDEPVSITIRAMAFRPEQVPATSVTAYLDDQELGKFTPTRDWQTFSFYGQSTSSCEGSTLSFKAKAFNPAALGISNDTRDLGFLIDWIRVTSYEKDISRK